MKHVMQDSAVMWPVLAQEARAAQTSQLSQAAEGVEGAEARRGRSMLDRLPFSVIVTDARGIVVTSNPAATQLLGFRTDELVGGTLSRIDGAQRPCHADGALFADALEGAEWVYRRKDGVLVPVQETVVALATDDGVDEGYLVVAYDITRRVETRDRVEHLATHDSLTNLPNRTMLVRHLEQAVEEAGETGQQLTLLLLDLDHFKRVNDTLGHHIGDELLLVVADRLLAWTRPGDFVARLGGDEFVLVFPAPPAAELEQRLEHLVSDVLAPVVIHGYELLVTCSVGGAHHPVDGADPGTLLKHADIAMYQAKAAGRSTVQWFAPAMLEVNSDRLALSSALRNALAHDELSLVFQPQLDLVTGDVTGVEALARWEHPVLGPVPPDRFIPVAEDGGMIARLGSWVIRSACRSLAQVQQELGRPLRLAVNVSPLQMRGSAWLEDIVDALSSAGIEPSQLEVEITEGLLIEDHGDVAAMLQSLRALGVTVAVDDFGRGYSSLAYLTRFPIDKIKIDRSFVQEITSVGSNAAIVDAIIVMAHALGMTVVAEGVESEAQEAYLRARGCDEVQGYRYSPGVPAGALAMVSQALSRSAPQ